MRIFLEEADWSMFHCHSLELADLGDVVGKINESVGVSPLVIVPGDELNEVRGQ